MHTNRIIQASAVLRTAGVVLFLATAFARCASMMTPQGGPRDSLPPVVVSATPRLNDTNFTGKRIFIEFNEYVQLKDQHKEFFTSPRMKTKPTLTIRGRGIQIDIQDTLRPNTTYALNFGSSVRDNNESNPLHGLRYVFSTGPQIDSMWMSGYTADALKADSVSKSYIYFYPADSIGNRIDSLGYDSTLFLMAPAAIARAETNGIFIAQNLKPIPYRVYAFEDKNDNQLYDAGTDQVGFLDSLFNPAELPEFAIWYDSLRLYTTAEPQLYLRMFTDGTFRRQLLSSSERPLQHQALLLFGAPFPRIDSLLLDSIPPERVIVDYRGANRDTVALWFDMPGELLPDTIRGRISYLKHDSLNRLQPVTEKLALSWRFIESREEQRKRERAERARAKAEAAGEPYRGEAVPNPFSFKFDAKEEINPEKGLRIEFAYPVVEMDSARISLVETDEQGLMNRIPVHMRRDTADLRRWSIDPLGGWQIGRQYALMIPDSVFRNVAGQRNDTISLEATIMQPDQYATLIVHVKGKSPESCYVLQLMDGAGKRVLEERRHARQGDYRFRFIPAGEVRLRVVEDSNCNGVWDTGNLLEGRQPERVEMFVGGNGEEAIATRVNWEIEIDADMNLLFAPVTMQSLIRQLDAREAVRLAKYLEEKARKDAEEQKNQHGGSGSTSGFGGLGGLSGGMRTTQN